VVAEAQRRPGKANDPVTLGEVRQFENEFAALYVPAKLAEYQDRTIYSAGSIMSGHTLKHLLAAAACFAILRYFQTRRPIA